MWFGPHGAKTARVFPETALFVKLEPKLSKKAESWEPEENDLSPEI
jgi:hypothetical protein